MYRALSDILNGHLVQQGWSFEKLAEEAGLPRNTVYRWTRGEVRRVRHWQDLAKAAHALALNTSQANALLAVGGHPPSDVLLKQARNVEAQELLARWMCTSPNNLPAQLTSFVGRQTELAQVTHLLSSTRLVTLTGPGGSGKTRLAIETALAMADEFEEIAFVDLSSIHEPALVPLAISEALGIPASPDESLQHALASHLRDRNVLLVLDNLEQVIEAAPFLAVLIGTTCRTKMLVTSRTRLHVRGEHTFTVHPLPLPGKHPDVDTVARNPSVALFLDRVRAVNPSFTPTRENIPLIAELCSRLDGLPLAIELAAARTAQVPLHSMLKRGPGGLGLASNGPRDAPARHRSLHASIAWSYNLLCPDSQRVFDSLGAFTGSFTEDEALSACEEASTDALESLIEHHLVRHVPDTGDEPRYEMLSTIREFALEKLNARRETAQRKPVG